MIREVPEWNKPYLKKILEPKIYKSYEKCDYMELLMS